MKEELPVMFLEGEELVEKLKELNVGETTDYLINTGTKRTTLAAIEKARINKVFTKEKAKFVFGEMVRDGQHKFIGIKVKRTE